MDQKDSHDAMVMQGFSFAARKRAEIDEVNLELAFILDRKDSHDAMVKEGFSFAARKRAEIDEVNLDQSFIWS